MTNFKLTPTQHAVLTYAIDHTDGRIVWFPESVNGGARQKVLQAMSKRKFILMNNGQWCVASQAYDGLGRVHPVSQPTRQSAGTPRPRPHSKQATVVAMLRRSDGATIAQIMEATGWQAHTVRGTFAGVIKKRLGHDLVSTKTQAGERVYHIICK